MGDDEFKNNNIPFTRGLKMKTEKVLVVGASGTVGSELARLLKRQGVHVRTTTSRKVTDSSSDQVQVSLATGEGLRAAFEGVDKAFLLSPPGYADQYALLAPLIQEAKRRGLTKVVLMTSMVANDDESAPFRKAERELERSGLSYNILRPNWFYQNFNTFWLHGIRAQHKISLPAGKNPVSFVDARDIAQVAAVLLTTDAHPNRVFDLTGPAALDHAQVAQAIGLATNTQVVYQEISSEEFKQGLLSAGLPGDYVEFMLSLFGLLREGVSTRVSSDVQAVLGREPRGLTEYLEAHRSHFISGRDV